MKLIQEFKRSSFLAFDHVIIVVMEFPVGIGLIQCFSLKLADAFGWDYEVIYLNKRFNNAPRWDSNNDVDLFCLIS